MTSYLPPEPVPALDGAAATDETVPNVTAPAGGVKRAAMWTLIGYIGAQIVRFASNLILTRLVAPDVFGQMSLVYTFTTGLHMFTDVGLGTSIIQSKRGDDPDFYNTAWTLQILRGMVIALGTVVLAWPAAVFWDKPWLLYLLPAVGANEFINAFASTSLHALNRHLRRDRYVILDLSTTVIGSSVTIAYAFWSPTAWALIFGPMVNFILMMAFSHVILPGYRNRLRWDPTAVHELIHFGKWIFLGTICTFLAFQADKLIIGKLYSERQLGIYYIAANLVGVATSLLSVLAGQLVFPLYSRMHQEGRDIRLEFGRVHGTAAGVAALLTAGMLATGPAAIRVMYPNDYDESGWIMQWLAVGAWFGMLEGTVGASLLALGQSRSVMLSNATKLAGLILLVPFGFHLGGFEGVLIGFIVSDFLRYLMVLALARINGMRGWPYDLALTALIAAFAPVGYFAGDWLAAGLLGGAPAARGGYFVLFACQGVLVVSLWGLIGLAWWKRGGFVLRAQESA